MQLSEVTFGTGGSRPVRRSSTTNRETGVDPRPGLSAAGSREDTSRRRSLGTQIDGLARSGDALELALQFFVYRDLMDGIDHVLEDGGWTPITVALAERLRELNDRHGLWTDEPDVVRTVLDGAWAPL